MVAAWALAAAVARAGTTIGSWDVQRKGANLFDRVETRERLRAAADAGIHLVRLTPSKWKGAKRDFLIGNADEYRGLVPADLARLKAVLDDAQAAGIHVVLTPLSLPGCRWKQQNRGADDRRLWRSAEYQTQAAAFWRDLARALRNHPAIAAYDLLNEPHPERLTWKRDFWTLDPEAQAAAVRWTRADLNQFYGRVVRAIREADPDTPVIVEAGLYANPWMIRLLDPLPDPAVLYEIHMYEPYAYTHWKLNRGRKTYPGALPGTAKSETATAYWDAAAVAAFFQPVVDWQRANGVSAKRVFVGEFGCDRRAPGAEAYLRDLVAFFDARGWHWAFYAFREDGWDAMDYELGTKGLGAKWWAEEAAGLTPPRPWHDNPLFDVLRREFAVPTP